jgi:N-acetyl sugar amidotransferase
MVSTKEYQQCTRCVMDTTDPQITFDAKGQCNHCTEFISVRSNYLYKGAESDAKLEADIEKMRKAGKGKEYDCIVGVSGGVDSSYVAYLCKQKGLRVLGVHMDNGWNAEEANLNIKNITRKLGIDYESYVLDWEEFKDLQLSFLKAAVPEAETPTDIAIQGALHKVAAKYGVKYIISGGNMASEGILPKCWHYNAKDGKYLNAIHNRFGKVRLKNFPTFSFVKETYYKLVKGINTIYILNNVPYVKEDAMQILKDSLDWKYYGGKHYESKYTSFIQSYYLFEKFPIDYRRATFSSQICTGEVSREFALEELKTKPYNEAIIDNNKKYIAKKLAISNEEFESILKIPGKFYFAYPNSEKLLNFIYTTYRKIYKKEKLGSV